MPLEQLILFFLLVLIAEVIGTVGGFGSSVMFVPVAGFFFDIQTVLGITAIFHVSSNIAKISLFKSGIDKKLIMTIGIPATALVIVGAYLSSKINNQTIEMALAIFVILLSLSLLINKNLIITPNEKNAILGGAISGFAAGLVGTGGAIRGLVLASYNLKMETFIATSAIIDLAIDLSRSVVYISQGYVQYNSLYLLPFLFVISYIGSYLGKKILSKFGEDRFKKTVLIFVLITGVISLVKVLI